MSVIAQVAIVIGLLILVSGIIAQRWTEGNEDITPWMMGTGMVLIGIPAFLWSFSALTAS